MTLNYFLIFFILKMFHDGTQTKGDLGPISMFLSIKQNTDKCVWGTEKGTQLPFGMSHV